MDTKQNETSAELLADGAAEDVPPCPFCGKSVDFEDDDTLYPTGTYWRDEPQIGCRTYHGRRQWNEGDGVCFGMHCPMPAGGCGAQITGDSKEEALAAWSQRATADLERLPERVKELNQTLWSRERDLDARDCRIAQLEADIAALKQAQGEPFGWYWTCNDEPEFQVNENDDFVAESYMLPLYTSVLSQPALEGPASPDL